MTSDLFTHTYHNSEWVKLILVQKIFNHPRDPDPSKLGLLWGGPDPCEKQVQTLPFEGQMIHRPHSPSLPHSFCAPIAVSVGLWWTTRTAIVKKVKSWLKKSSPATSSVHKKQRLLESKLNLLDRFPTQWWISLLATGSSHSNWEYFLIFLKINKNRKPIQKMKGCFRVLGQRRCGTIFQSKNLPQSRQNLGPLLKV